MPVRKFAAPISDLSFVYHQIGTTQPSNFRALRRGVTVDSFSNLSSQFQTNNYFGFTNILFDELQLDFVGDFNMGAMENKGLNIFNTKYVLARADTATDNDFMFLDRVVAHEYFHNWTGNRVTCRDWF